MRKDLEKKLVILGMAQPSEFANDDLAKMINSNKKFGMAIGKTMDGKTHALFLLEKGREMEIAKGDLSAVVHTAQHAEWRDCLADALAFILESGRDETL